MAIGDERYLRMLSDASWDTSKGSELFGDVFRGATSELQSVKVPEFYARCYEKSLTTLKRLAIDKSNPNSAWPNNGTGEYAGYGIETAFQTEAFSLSLSSQWLHDQILKQDLIGSIMQAILPVYLFEIFDQLRIVDSIYETNEFNYLYYLAVLKKILIEPPSGATVGEKMKSTMTRWWLFYIVDSLKPNAKAMATEFISHLNIKTDKGNVSRQEAATASKTTLYKLKEQIRSFLLESLKEGTGNHIYEYVRRYLNELAMIRQNHDEVARIELSLNQVDNSPTFKVKVNDKSKWITHTKRLADSFSHQLYINKDGVLEPQLDTREISSFITGLFSFSEGAGSDVEIDVAAVMNMALDPRHYIDVSRISSYINENGFSIPHNIDNVTIIYNSSYKDLWFSSNSYTNMGEAISALDLAHHNTMLSLTKGNSYVMMGETFNHPAAVSAELALKVIQRFFALIIPETSPTGNLQITYDNVFGMPFIDEYATGGVGAPFYYDYLVKGMNVDLYNNITPVVSFLKAMRMDDIVIERDKHYIIGAQLFNNLLNLMKQFGLEALKEKMLPYYSSLTPLPTDRNVYPEWTSAIGQSNANVRISGYGDKILEWQCIKSLFASTNSSQLNTALVKTLAIGISYGTSAIAAQPILSVFKQ